MKCFIFVLIHFPWGVATIYLTISFYDVIKLCYWCWREREREREFSEFRVTRKSLDFFMVDCHHEFSVIVLGMEPRLIWLCYVVLVVVVA